MKSAVHSSYLGVPSQQILLLYTLSYLVAISPQTNLNCQATANLISNLISKNYKREMK